MGGNAVLAIAGAAVLAVALPNTVTTRIPTDIVTPWIASTSRGQDSRLARFGSAM
ncbi:hypothetical protein ACFRAQ_09065 [Nocardia sp. NPDC056611]|uniref:hypothetical protein n=1 Tax=Nocardia sp. NPDC056611 TaxID=3345877 RepID=UPI0036708F71